MSLAQKIQKPSNTTALLTKNRKHVEYHPMSTHPQNKPEAKLQQINQTVHMIGDKNGQMRILNELLEIADAIRMDIDKIRNEMRMIIRELAPTLKLAKNHSTNELYRELESGSATHASANHIYRLNMAIIKLIQKAMNPEQTTAPAPIPTPTPKQPPSPKPAPTPTTQPGSRTFPLSNQTLAPQNILAKKSIRHLPLERLSRESQDILENLTKERGKTVLFMGREISNEPAIIIPIDLPDYATLENTLGKPGENEMFILLTEIKPQAIIKASQSSVMQRSSLEK